MAEIERCSDAARLIDDDLNYEKLDTRPDVLHRRGNSEPIKPPDRASGGAITEVPA